MKFHIAKIVGFLLLFVVQVGYSEIDILSQDSILIFNNEDVKDTTITFTCSKPNTTVIDAFAKFENFGYVRASYNGAYYTALLQIFNLQSNYGNKTIFVRCVYSDNSDEIATTNIVIDKIELKITQPTFNNPLEIYNGEYITSLQAELSMSYLTPDVYNLKNIKAYLRSSEGNYQLENILVSYSGNTINVFAYIPYEVKENIYDIEISAQYYHLGNTFHLSSTSSRALKITSPIKVEILSPSSGEVVKVSSSLTQRIKFKVYEKGNEIIDLSSTNIEFKLGERALEFSLKYDSDAGEYVADINIIKPQSTNATEENIYLVIKNYKDYPPIEQEILKAEYVVSLSGKTITKSGKIINTRFVLDNGKKIYEFSSDNKGNYNILVPKGTYNISIFLNKVDKVEIKNVKIDRSVENFIKINYPPYTTEEFRIIKSLVIEIAAEYERSEAEIYYDDTKIVDERNIIALYCDYWNFGLERCEGDIKKYDHQLNIISNTVSVKDFKGNILLAEKKKIMISIESSKKDFYVNDEVTIIGFVKDYDGNAQKNIEVKYLVKGTGIQGKTITDKNGKFEIRFLAPRISSRIEDKELVVYIDSDKIESKNATYTFTVEKRVKLVGYVDEIVEVYKGIETPINIEISNEGDLDLTDVEIRIAGLKEDWYIFTPSFIETIKPGDKINIKMKVKIDCDKGEECKEYYFVNMRIKAREDTEDISFTIRVIENKTQTIVEQNKEVKEKSLSETITGNIPAISIEMPSKTNTYILIGFIIIATLMIIVKKKRRNPVGIRRSLLLRKRI